MTGGNCARTCKIDDDMTPQYVSSRVDHTRDSLEADELGVVVEVVERVGAGVAGVRVRHDGAVDGGREGGKLLVQVGVDQVEAGVQQRLHSRFKQ